MCSTCRPWELPQAGLQRTRKWADAMDLPRSEEAYRTLLLQKAPAHLNAIVERAAGHLFPSAKARRALQRTWGFMLIHEAALAEVAAAPWAAAVATRCFPASPHTAFEHALHHLINVAPYVGHPEVLDALDGVLGKRSPALHRHLAAIGSAPQVHFGLLLERAFVTTVAEKDWFPFFEEIAVSPDGSAAYFRSAVAVLECLKAPLMGAANVADVIRVLSTTVVPDVQQVMRRRAAMGGVRIPLGATRAMPKGASIYPSLHDLIGGRQAPPPRISSQSAVTALRAIADDEEAKSRRLENNLKALEVTLAQQRRDLALLKNNTAAVASARGATPADTSARAFEIGDMDSMQAALEELARGPSSPSPRNKHEDPARASAPTPTGVPAGSALAGSGHRPNSSAARSSTRSVMFAGDEPCSPESITRDASGANSEDAGSRKRPSTVYSPSPRADGSGVVRLVHLPSSSRDGSVFRDLSGKFSAASSTPYVDRSSGSRPSQYSGPIAHALVPPGAPSSTDGAFVTVASTPSFDAYSRRSA